MINKMDSRSQIDHYAFTRTVLLFLLAHAYRFLTLGYTDDSVEIAQGTGAFWQFQLGRFVQPYYWRLRGELVMPYLIGLIACVLLALSVVLIVRMLRLRRRSSILILSALLTANELFSIANSMYVSWTDVYMLALLLALLCVRCWDAGGAWVMLAPALLFLSLGLYQCYIQVAALMMLIVLARDAMEGMDARRIFLRGLLALGVLLVALLLYAYFSAFFAARNEVNLYAGYNGVANVSSLTPADLLAQLLPAYRFALTRLVTPITHLSSLAGTLYALLALTIPVQLVILLRISKAMRPDQRALLILATLLMPLAMNGVYLISNGIMYAPMIFSYYTLYAYALLLAERLCDRAPDSLRIRLARPGRATKALRAIAHWPLVAAAVLFFCNTVYANQSYLRRDLEYGSTLSLATRAIARMEQIEGFVPGKTPVAFVGTMYDSPLSMARPGFEHLSDAQITPLYYAVSHERYYPWFFWDIMGYPVNIVSTYELEQLYALPQVRQMPAFPAEGSIAFAGDTLVVKLGMMGNGQ